jgi:hypothetical protein
MALLIAASACQQEEVKHHTVYFEPQAKPQPPLRASGLSSTAEDANQLTPDEQARFDQMVEGTSPIPECNELIRQLRTLSACTKYPPQGRTMLQRSALLLGELGEGDTSERLGRACKDANAIFVKMIKRAGC